MSKPKNKDPKVLIHVLLPEEYHIKLKMQSAHDGSNITETVTKLVENYLIAKELIKKVVDKSIIVDT